MLPLRPTSVGIVGWPICVVGLEAYTVTEKALACGFVQYYVSEVDLALSSVGL